MLYTTYPFVDQSQPQTLLISGNAKSGKTRLARALVANHIERGDYVLWIEFDGNKNDEFRRWLEYFTVDYGNADTAKSTLYGSALHIHDLVPRSVDAIKQMIDSVLESHKASGSRIVIVINEGGIKINGPVMSYAKEHGCNIIITYTRSNAPLEVDGVCIGNDDRAMATISDAHLYISSYDTAEDKAYMHVIRDARMGMPQASVDFVFDARSGVILDVIN